MGELSGATLPFGLAFAATFAFTFVAALADVLCFAFADGFGVALAIAGDELATFAAFAALAEVAAACASAAAAKVSWVLKSFEPEMLTKRRGMLLCSARFEISQPICPRGHGGTCVAP